MVFHFNKKGKNLINQSLKFINLHSRKISKVFREGNDKIFHTFVLNNVCESIWKNYSPYNEQPLLTCRLLAHSIHGSRGWLRRMKERKKEREKKKKEKLRKGGRQGDYKYLIAGCLKRLDPRKDNIRLFARFG